MPSTAAERWAGKAPLRVLVGPFIHPVHYAYMHGAFDDFDCLSFGSGPGVDLPLRSLPTLDELLEALPPGWEPDLLLLWRPEYTSPIQHLEAAPFPVIALISDWYYSITLCLEVAGQVDRMVVGSRGEKILRRAGLENVLRLPMLGYQPGVDGSERSAQRDIDIFSATNPNWVVHQEREHICQQLLEMSPEAGVVLRENIPRAHYNELLGRSRIFVNQTIVGEINMKCYEVPNAGACLFVEDTNLDIREHLVEGESVVLYSPENLKEKLRYYLHHEEERAAIAAAGELAMRSLSYRENMRRIVETLRLEGRERLLATPRMATRQSSSRSSVAYATCALRHNNNDLSGLHRALRNMGESPYEILLQCAGAYLFADAANQLGEKEIVAAIDPDQVVAKIKELAAKNPDDFVLQMPAVQVSAIHAMPEEFSRTLNGTLKLLGEEEDLELSGNALQFIPDAERNECEQAFWRAIDHGEDPSQTLRPLLRLQIHMVASRRARAQGDQKKEIQALRRAVAACPDSFRARPFLGLRLGEMGRWHEAREVWKAHLKAHPMSEEARTGLFQACFQLGDRVAALRGLEELARFFAVRGKWEGLKQVQTLQQKLGADRNWPDPLGGRGAPDLQMPAIQQVG